MEQDINNDYVIESAGGRDVDFHNLTAAALIAELAKQNVRC